MSHQLQYFFLSKWSVSLLLHNSAEIAKLKWNYVWWYTNKVDEYHWCRRSGRLEPPEIYWLKRSVAGIPVPYPPTFCTTNPPREPSLITVSVSDIQLDIILNEILTIWRWNYMSNKKYDSHSINISPFSNNCFAAKLNNSHHFITSLLTHLCGYNNRGNAKRSLRWCSLLF